MFEFEMCEDFLDRQIECLVDGIARKAGKIGVKGTWF
jgi:hypothetical protein